MHDSVLLQDTLEAIVVDPPNPLKHPQHLCLDMGYRGASCDATARVFGYVPHVRQIGHEKLDDPTSKGARKRHPARRWVVERGHAWWNGCRSILIRWAKKSSNYLAFIELDSALLWYRRLKQLSSF